MSFTGSVQQLGTAAASLMAGVVVAKGSHGEIYHFEWLGYTSVLILMICILLSYRIFKSTSGHAPRPVARIQPNKPVALVD